MTGRIANPVSATRYCADLLRRYDRDRYVTSLFAPADRRPALQAVYAFNLEVARTREAVSEPMLGEIRLQWWREAVAEMFAGTPRQPEVVAAVSATLGHRPELRVHFDAIIDARAADLYDQSFATLADLETYADATSAGVVRLALATLNVRVETQVEDAARHAGIAYALSGLLGAVWYYARRNRLVLPVDMLARHGIAVGDVAAGRNRGQVHPLLDELADGATEHLVAARGALPDPPSQAIPALLPATLASARLARLRRQGYPAAEQRPTGPGPADIMRLLLNAWRRRF